MKTHINAAIWLILLVFSIANASATPTCQKTGEVCTDTTPCKIINGVNICLTAIGQTCWSYQDTYNCINPNLINYCQPLINMEPTCSQSGSTCAQYDTTFGTGCMVYTNTFTCAPGGPSTTPANTVQLSNSYTLLSSNYDPAPCASLSAAPNCTVAAPPTCTSTTPPSPLPAGINPAQVAPDGCYQQTQNYVCLAGTQDSSECATLAADPTCSKVGSPTCLGPQIGTTGPCQLQQLTYNCMSSPAQSSTNLDCSGQMFCMNGNCANTGYQNDPAFAQAMVMMESAREGGNYNNNTKIFTGDPDQCHINNGGLANCCNLNGVPTAPSDFEIMGVAYQVGAATGANAAIAQAGSAISQYTFDTIINPVSSSLSSMFATGATSAATSSATATTASATTATTTATTTGVTSSAMSADITTEYSGLYTNLSADLASAPAATGPMAATCATGATAGAAPSAFSTIMTSVNSFMAAAGPYILAAEVAFIVYSELSSCSSPSDLKTNEARKQSLCHEIGSYCSSKTFFGICSTKTQSYCCYNTILARIINEQGRPQIGKSWGSAQSPDCSGFTTTDIAKIDFSKIDFSEFIKSIMSDIQLPTSGNQGTQITNTVTNKVNNYYSTGAQ